MFDLCDIKTVQRYGERGWKWTIDTEIGERTYRTNGDGEGLWYCSQRGDHIQHRGTQQYSLPQGEGPRNAKIYKTFSTTGKRVPRGPQYEALVQREQHYLQELESGI